jgi:8-oxo-dGTP pyrophosphatase MutT (NUDIX family)
MNVTAYADRFKKSPNFMTLKFRNKTCIYDNSSGGVREVSSINDTHLLKKSNLYCLNCNKRGHNYRNCRFPTNSYGCVIFKMDRTQSTNLIDIISPKITSSENRVSPKYLLIQRKYTPVYIELLRARYYEKNMINLQYLELLIIDLPMTERYYINNHDFDYLWHALWRWVGTDEQMQTISEDYEFCKSRFNLLKSGDFKLLCDKHPPLMIEPDWEFPKGRRNESESDQQCAIRECYEETTLKITEDYKIFMHVKPFQEKITGINQIRYCNSYYLSELTNPKKLIYYDPTQTEQNKEIRKIGWFTYEEACRIINPNHKYRLKMLTDINSLVLSFSHSVPKS